MLIIFSSAVFTFDDIGHMLLLKHDVFILLFFILLQRQEQFY